MTRPSFPVVLAAAALTALACAVPTEEDGPDAGPGGGNGASSSGTGASGGRSSSRVNTSGNNASSTGGASGGGSSVGGSGGGTSGGQSAAGSTGGTSGGGTSGGGGSGGNTSSGGGGAGSSSGGGTGSSAVVSSSTSMGPEYCPFRIVPTSENPANAFIIQDRSYSMTDNNKWTNAKTAITTMVTNYSSNTRFGLAMFPNVDVNNQQNCTAGNLRVPLATNPGDNNTAIINELNRVSPQGNTPTMETLQVFIDNTSLFGLTSNDRQNIIILITDGQPNCLDNANTGAGTISKLSQLHSLLGIAVYVVGFGSGIDPNILNNMADAGGVPQPGVQRYYRADNATQLNQVLDSIASTVEGCRFIIGGTVTNPSTMQVRIEGTNIPRDTGHTNGFDYDPATRAVTFYGPACTDPTYGSRQASPFQIVVEELCPGSPAPSSSSGL